MSKQFRPLILFIFFILPATCDMPPSRALAMARAPENFPVTVVVDFGPAGKPRVEQKVEVESGTTAKDAVSIVLPIRSGKSCCSVREVIEIDGVRVDPEKKRWWICLLNGSRNFSPRQKLLEPGDRIEWKYVETK